MRASPLSHAAGPVVVFGERRSVRSPNTPNATERAYELRRQIAAAIAEMTPVEDSQKRESIPKTEKGEGEA